MSTLKKSDKLTLIALLVGLIAGLAAHYYYDVSVNWSLFIGFILAGASLKSLQENAAATSLIDSKTINPD